MAGIANNFGSPKDKNTLASETGRAFLYGLANEIARSRARKSALVLKAAGALTGSERLRSDGVEAEKRGSDNYVAFTPRDRTADDLSERQKEFLAKVWGTYGFGIPDYKAYNDVSADIGDESLGHSAEDIRDWDFFTTAPAHQVEQLFGRASVRWNGDDLELVDIYDLPSGWNWVGKVIPGLPTEDSPNKGKIHSRISAKALGLDPRELHSTGVKNLQRKWDNIYEVMENSGYPLDEGRVTDDIPPNLAGYFDALAALKNQWDNLNSGPYKATGERGIGVWKSQKSIYTPVSERGTREAAKAGDAGESGASKVPSGHNPALDGYSGPRIVINPSTFKNEKDGLCVAFDEAFRILMEVNGFDPVAEPTEKQREFFGDTAYANDERMLRRTILARICTFDTSVTDPTDEQLQEAVEFLETVMEIGAPQNEWEQSAVQRIRDTVEKAIGQPAEGPEQPEKPEGSPVTAAGGGGSSDEEQQVQQATPPPPQQDTQPEQDDGQDPISEADMSDGSDTDTQDDTGDVQEDMESGDEEVDEQDPISEPDGPGEEQEREREQDKGAGAQPEEEAKGKIDAAGRMLDDHGRVMPGQTPQKPEQTFGGKIDNAGRMLDDHGRVMKGQTPSGRQLTSGEQQWADNRAATTEAYIQRKLEREQRRMANNADRIADREEFLGKVASGKFGSFGSRRELNGFIAGNSQSRDPYERTNEVLGRLYGKYGKYM